MYVDGGKRGPGDMVWSWHDLCFDHSMIYLSAYMIGFFLGGGGAGVAMVGLACAFISQ